MTKNIEKETALVEAILYMEGDPVDEDSISQTGGLSRDAVKAALENLKEKYNAHDCGLELSNADGKYSIFIKREYWDNLKEKYGKKNEGKISRAAMETLAIIAYKQPVTRAEIEKTRGVSADNMIKLLLEKDLIRKVGKKEIPGAPVTYGTTKEFLKIFNLNSISELPKLGESDIEKFELEGEKY
ncbi:MAG: SMC-Scp complex subunit ScpB [Treponema sp.]|nr:SMC-Scp complex subunit ScpB [Treponema sp.]